MAHDLRRPRAQPPALFAELTCGPPKTGAFVLNAGDAGLLASLDALSAQGH